MTQTTAISRLMDWVREQKWTPRFVARVPDEQILDQNCEVGDIEPGKHYFQARLAEIHLRNRREYWQEFVPLAVVVSKFDYGVGQETVPALVGSNLLEGKEVPVRGDAVQYRNTRVLGPVPYRGNDVDLFLGLYRMPAGNLARKLLGVIEGMLGELDAVPFGGYLKAARGLEKGMGALLGLTEVESKIAHRDVYSEAAAGGQPLRSGYVAYVNCGHLDLRPEHLWVVGQSLRVGTTPDTAQPLTEYDYCLLGIEKLAEIRSLGLYPFHRSWEQAIDRIASNDPANAQLMLAACMREVALSADLTSDQAARLNEVYLANFCKQQELFDRARNLSGGTLRAPVRGGETSVRMSGKFALHRMADVAAADSKVSAANTALIGMARAWESIPGAPTQEGRIVLDADTISRQCRFFAGLPGAGSASASTLAEAAARAGMVRLADGARFA